MIEYMTYQFFDVFMLPRSLLTLFLVPGFPGKHEKNGEQEQFEDYWDEHQRKDNPVCYGQANEPPVRHCVCSKDESSRSIVALCLVAKSSVVVEER